MAALISEWLDGIRKYLKFPDTNYSFPWFEDRLRHRKKELVAEFLKALAIPPKPKGTLHLGGTESKPSLATVSQTHN